MTFLAQGGLEWLPHIGDNGIAVAILVALIIGAGAWVLVTRSNNARVTRLAELEHDRQLRRDKQEADRLLEKDKLDAQLQQAQTTADQRTAAALESLDRRLKADQDARKQEEQTREALSANIAALGQVVQQMLTLVKTAQTDMTARSDARDKKLAALSGDVTDLGAQIAAQISEARTEIIHHVQAMAGSHITVAQLEAAIEAGMKPAIDKLAELFEHQRETKLTE